MTRRLGNGKMLAPSIREKLRKLTIEQQYVADTNRTVNFMDWYIQQITLSWELTRELIDDSQTLTDDEKWELGCQAKRLQERIEIFKTTMQSSPKGYDMKTMIKG